MTNRLRVLMVASRPEQAESVIGELRRAGYDVESKRAANEAEYRGLLEPAFDLILAGHAEEGFSTIQALEILREAQQDTAFIVIADPMDRTAMECLRQGADQYVLTTQLEWLGPAVESAMRAGRAREEKRAAERALHISEAKYDVIFRESLDVIMIVEADSGKIINANRAAGRVLGYETAKLAGTPFSALFPPEAALDERELVERLRVYGSVLEFQTFVRADGVNIPMDVTAMLTPWPEGEVITMTLRDVSERLMVEEERLQNEELRLKLNQERELSHLRNRFMAAASHEFRTPLAVILTSAELLERYFDRMSEERRLAALTTIREQIDHLSLMLGNVSLILRAESGRLDFNPVYLDLHYLCEEVVRELQYTLGVSHRLSLTSEGIVHGLLIDTVLVQRALKHLLTNSIKYSAQGSQIRVHLERQETSVTIRVSDDGIGIPEDDLPRLFEAYFRARNVGIVAGSGLGLRIVRDAVERHGGSITVESQENRGTTFTIQLPVTL